MGSPVAMPQCSRSVLAVTSMWTRCRAAKPTRPAPGDSGDRISVPNASSGSSPQEHLEAMKALRPERRSACARVLGAADTTRYTSAAALSLVTTALTVAGYQRVLPREVAMPSAINPSAIA